MGKKPVEWSQWKWNEMLGMLKAQWNDHWEWNVKLGVFEVSEMQLLKMKYEIGMLEVIRMKLLNKMQIGVSSDYMEWKLSCLEGVGVGLLHQVKSSLQLMRREFD